MSSASMGGLDRLAEIDRELDSFGKDEGELRDVLARARQVAPGGLDEVDAALEGLAEGVSVLPAIPPRVETQAPPGASARPASWDERAVLADVPDDASGIVELPEEELRRESLPPVLSLPDEPTVDAAALAEDVLAGALEDDALLAGALAPEEAAVEELPVELEPDATAFAAGDGSSLELDIAGELADVLSGSDGAAVGDRSLEALFDDTSLPPPGGDDLGSGGLADLFESDRPEAEPGAHQSLADLLTPELRAELASEGLAPEPEEESTSLFSADEMRAIRESAAPDAPSLPVAEAGASSGEFELMIDEEMLELDADEPPVAAAPAKKPTMPPPPPMPSVLPPSGSQPPPDQKGFFSRMLNRK